MDLTTLINVLFRWIHIGAAIMMLGGSLYVRFILMPSAAQLEEAAQNQLRQQIQQRWKKVVMIGILLLLVSGFYNYLQVSAPAHEGQGKYHMLMGMKILLALGVFFFASVLTGRSATFESMRQQPKKWLTLTILLASAVVAIAGLLKVAFPVGG